MKKKLLNSVISAALVGLALLMTGCIKDEISLDKVKDNVYLTPEIAIPLVNSRQSIEDIMRNVGGNITIQYDSSDNNLVIITYRDSLVSLRADETLDLLQQFNDIQISPDLQLAPFTTVFPGSGEIGPYLIKDSLAFTYDQNGQIIDSLFLDELTLTYNITNGFDHSVNLVIEYPTIFLDGAVFTHEVDLAPNGQAGDTYNETILYEDVKITLDNETNPDTSYLFTNYYFSATQNTSAPDPTQLTLGNDMNVEMTLDNMDFHSVFGYIGQHNVLSQTEEISIRIFENEFQGLIEFQEPRLVFDVTNSYGVPVEIVVDNVYAYHTKDTTNKREILFNAAQDASKVFEVPSPSVVGDVETDEFIIGEENTSFAQALSINPDKLFFTASGTVNPGGYTGSRDDYVIDTSMFDVTMNLELVMDVKTSKYIVTDTLPFQISEIVEQYDFINRLLLVLNTENGLPTDIDVQVYFLDSNKTMIDSLFKLDQGGPNIQAASYNFATERVIETTKSTDVGEMNDPANNYMDVAYLLLQSCVNTKTNNGSAKFVRFYAQDELYLQLGMYVDGEYEGTLDDFMNSLSGDDEQ